MFFTLVINSAHAQENIKFTEEEDIPVNEDFIKEHFKLDKLTIAQGDYEVVFNEKNPNGIIYFKLVPVYGDEGGDDGYVEGVGVRIAKRTCSKCKYSCECCVGFRCGFVTLNTEKIGPENPRIAEVNLTLNKKEGFLKVEFTKPIDWEKMDN